VKASEVLIWFLAVNFLKAHVLLIKSSTLLASNLVLNIGCLDFLSWLRGRVRLEADPLSFLGDSPILVDLERGAVELLLLMSMSYLRLETEVVFW
jgi:hypothetical protein